MFTFSLLYVILYLYIFLALLVLTFSQLPIYILTHFSTPNVLVFIQKYKPSKNLYYWLFFSLTGLPPVGLFFVKFNIFFYVLYQSHILIICMLFLVFFLNMLYYMQLFGFRNSKRELYSVINPAMITMCVGDSAWRSLSTYNTYYFTLLTVNVLLVLILTVIFFADYYLIVQILV